MTYDLSQLRETRSAVWQLTGMLSSDTVFNKHYDKLQHSCLSHDPGLPHANLSNTKRVSSKVLYDVGKYKR